jgi:outer membrane lipoprotein carrier protein
LMRKLLLVFLMCMNVSSAQSDSARERLGQLLLGIESLRADFEQNIFNAAGELQYQSVGKFSLLRPGYFRWEYTAPWLQTILSDGKRVWLYDADLEQVTIRDMSAGLSKTPAALLSGDISKLEGFDVFLTIVADDMIRFELSSAAEDNDFDRVTLFFRGKQLNGLELIDKLGQITRISFSNLLNDLTLIPTDFDLVIPDTVDVIDESNF